ncbi:MAG: hypothetical protein U1D30_13540 [Planctomycetota bacterium]
MKSSRTVELNDSMIAFLEEMARTYNLPSMDKAIRCLVNYARDVPERRGDIFEDVRCLDC